MVECKLCGREDELEYLEHLRIYHKAKYIEVKDEFIENCFIVGLGACKSRKSIEQMSGEDLQKEIYIRNIKIPKEYLCPDYSIVDGKKCYDTQYDYLLKSKVEKIILWYKQKVLIDERAKELINVLKPKLEKFGIEEGQIRLIHALINHYTKKEERSCYNNAEGIAIASILTTTKIGYNDKTRSNSKNACVRS